MAELSVHSRRTQRLFSLCGGNPGPVSLCGGSLSRSVCHSSRDSRPMDTSAACSSSIPPMRGPKSTRMRGGCRRQRQYHLGSSPTAMLPHTPGGSPRVALLRPTRSITHPPHIRHFSSFANHLDPSLHNANAGGCFSRPRRSPVPGLWRGRLRSGPVEPLPVIHIDPNPSSEQSVARYPIPDDEAGSKSMATSLPSVLSCRDHRSPPSARSLCRAFLVHACTTSTLSNVSIPAAVSFAFAKR
ncbi:hypothetical protein FB45DRAFT_176754 [Roridomyces roridus]|uniref:Uncharacterized protein n=1 Tax=Roridomyces roridus TaxID=1738132 RepID=A0AAD7CDU0_9AGAR|nr:hypothetical protein FB45DRAFT_176754 [Roridomyces roridus]